MYSNTKIIMNEKLLVIGCIILISGLSAAGCSAPGTTGQTGFLEGMVILGPLCPVEPCHLTGEQQAAAYGARHIIITREGPDAGVFESGFSPDGHYRVALPPGQYIVTLVKNGIDRTPDLPKTVVIRPGETVTLNISIDTGIR
jgi:hypothetical protein